MRPRSARRAVAIATTLLIALGSTTAAAVTPPSLRITAHTASWRSAIEVPGFGALNSGGGTGESVISCASAGSCAAGGSYADATSTLHAYLVDEVAGRWSRAFGAPGVIGGPVPSGVTAISCPGVGDCAALGQVGLHPQVFVVEEHHGVWGRAGGIPGLAALNQGGDAWGVLSCPSPGNCAAGGTYLSSAQIAQAWVANERMGRWGVARGVSGVIAPTNGNTWIDAISCGSLGDCSAGGLAMTSNGRSKAFVVSESGWTWAPGQFVRPYLGGTSQITSISCTGPGQCAAGGTFDDHGVALAVVDSETNGTWHQAQPVPGINQLSHGRGSQLVAISCSAPGRCAAGGLENGVPSNEAFVVRQNNGVWGIASVPSGLGVRSSAVVAVSCSRLGACAVLGYDFPANQYHEDAFIVSSPHGAWGRVALVPGLAALDVARDATPQSLSCSPDGTCGAIGSYADATTSRQDFVDGGTIQP
jgi:hypothetical protein